MTLFVPTYPDICTGWGHINQHSELEPGKPGPLSSGTFVSQDGLLLFLWKRYEHVHVHCSFLPMFRAAGDN